MEEIEEEFKKQFDPNHPTYHNSKDTRPIVPYAGVSKVPSSMPNERPENFQEQQVDEAPINYGVEFDSIQAVRELLGDLKKKIVAVTQPMEAVIRLTSNGAPESQISVEEKKKATAIDSLNSLKELFQQNSTGSEALVEVKLQVIDTITEGANKQYETTEELFDFASLCKRETQQIFNEQKQLLEKLKKIKKDYALAQQQQ